jgi:hypothetical protein
MTMTLTTHLDHRLDLLESLRDLAARQNEAIMERRTDELLRLLAERERLAEALLADAEAFDASAQEWKTSDRACNSEITIKLAKAESLLQEILAFDAADEAAIRESCGRITEEIKEVSATTAARNAYRGGTPVRSADSATSRFTDSTG